MTVDPLPLAAASQRLRRPGRPRKDGQAADKESSASRPTPLFTRSPRADVPETCPGPRLLDVNAAAAYLSISPWAVRDLEAAGELPRVRLPLGGRGDLRRLLFDRRDLDRLVDRSREGQGL
jgi:hypothetical protein